MGITTAFAAVGGGFSANFLPSGLDPLLQDFTQSNVGVLLAVKGASGLATLHLPPQATILGVILLTATIDLLIASASAKWALLSPIFVPMLMSLGISAEATQAAAWTVSTHPKRMANAVKQFAARGYTWMKYHEETRRQFFKQSTGTAALVAGATALGGVHAFAAEHPPTIRLGIIGCGGIMTPHVQEENHHEITDST